MQDSELAEQKPGSEETRDSWRRPATFFRGNWDFVGAVLLMAGTLPGFLIALRSVVVANPNLLDDSWLLDFSFKASRGDWLGGDVAFTYGPLFQWLSSAPARSAGLSMGAVYASWNLLPLWCAYLLIWGTIRLLLPEQPGWKRFVLFLLLAVFWFPSDLRMALSVFLFAFFADQWYRPDESKTRLWIVGSVAAALCAMAFLVSADTGIYALAAFVISLAGIAIGERLKGPQLRQVCTVLAAYFVASAGLVLVINHYLARATDFRFWRTSLAIVSGYRWMEASQMDKAGKSYLIAALTVGAIAFLLGIFSNVLSRDQVTKRTGVLLGAFVFCLLRMQSGLVRSDIGHVMIATFPMTLFVGVLLFAIRSRVTSAVCVLLFAAASWTLGQRNAALMPVNIVRSYAQALQPPNNECPAGRSEFSRVCFPSEFVHILQSGVGYLQQRSDPNQPVVVFPFQNLFGVASARNTAGGVLQSYLASGKYLSEVDIRGLEQQNAPAGLYFPDGTLSISVDGISNFTRSPEVWFWVQRHYQAEAEVAPGIAGLAKDNTRALKISQESQPLGLIPHTYPITKRSSLLDLGEISWPSQGADFLWLKVNVRYPMTWKLRKPQRLQMEISRSDGSRELRTFLAIPNLRSEVWIYPWDESRLTRYFESDEKKWSVVAPAITHLRLWVTPLDWVSQVTKSLTLEDARAVRISMR